MGAVDHEFLLAEYLLDTFVDDFELVGPVSGIEIGTHIIAIIVTTLGIKVEGRWQDGAFVSVSTVEGKESLYLHGKFFHILIGFLIIHSVEHRNRTQPLNLS